MKPGWLVCREAKEGGSWGGLGERYGAPCARRGWSGREAGEVGDVAAGAQGGGAAARNRGERSERSTLGDISL